MEACVSDCRRHYGDRVSNSRFRLTTGKLAAFGVDPNAQPTPAVDIEDARVQRISEGTTQILHLQIARHMLREWAKQA
jgi:alkylation response protein AidB-like acyl-CoA dehydrogenase